MSRIGRLPVPVESNVTVDLKGQSITVKSDRGSLTWGAPSEIEVTWNSEARHICCAPREESRRALALHGLTRSLISNMVTGVTHGFSKNLEVVGVGYSCAVQGRTLTLNVGYSNPVKIDIPHGIDVVVESASNPGRMTIRGIDKQRVGQFAADVRRVRPPEPYKGKGIKYADETVRRKAGKSFVSGQ